ncbi:retrovirus-related pol polyprotein from transposon TNT 1-94 [Tanacetum coccineum]|uniref:Retrovirus-related pol polyprotein from transposon TNT 1-94 n=1 Tax=Tanacetum coccineum TaxID=301880 RepID=A0ABQ4X115_9ASTR
MNKVLSKNERRLEQVINKDIVNIIINSSVDNASVNVHECEKCLTLETELLNKKDFVEKEIYDKLFKSFTTLEKHCISLEVDTQLNQEIFQRDNSVSNQSAPSFDQLFELNELKAQSQEKDTVIKKLKERIKSLSGKMNEDKIKKDLEEIETINIELDHRVSKLIAENEHLKQTYKQLYDSIKPTRIRSKEQSLKDDLRKLKGKALFDNAVTKHTIDPEMLKIDVESITPKLLNKKTAHSAYIKHTQEEAAVLRDLLLTNISKTYPNINNSGEKLVAVTPKNKDKRVRFTEPVISLGNTITKIASTSNLVSNKPMFSSTEVKLSTSASGSQPSGNTKKDKIQQTPTFQAKSNGCMLSDNHDLRVLDFINNVNARVKSKSVKKSLKRKVWKSTGKVITTTTEVPLRKPTALENETPKPVITLVYSRKPRKSKTNVRVSKSKVVQIVLLYLDSGCSKHMTGNRSQLTNFVNKFLGTIKFGNDHVAKILGYGDYQIGNVTISRVYYIEGLRHNLFSIGQFCYSNLKVAFCQHTCFILNLEGVDLLTGSRGNNLQKPRRNPTNLNLKTPTKKNSIFCTWIFMDQYVSQVFNGKKYILIIIDNYSRFTWVKCLRSKDKAPDFIIKFLKMIQVRLKVPVRRIRTDNGTEFVNQTLREYYEKVGISHETSVARSPQQNGVVERRNRMLIEVARIMLIYAKALLFLWAKAVATACYTKNRSIVRIRYGKTPYELLHDKLPNLSFFHVFGALCYLTNDSENLDFDELTAMASEHSSSGPALHEMTPAIISSGLVPNPPPSTPFVPPSLTDYDILFQPLFDELLNPSSSVDYPAPEVIAPNAEVVAPVPAASIDSPSSTTIDQDAPSPKYDSDASSSSDVIPTVVQTTAPNSEHVTK